MAAISLPFLATTSLNSPSTSSGESTTRTRAGVSDKLHQARDALADGRSRPRRSVQDLVTVGDSYRAFQNNEMFILIVMDMHWCAVARVRDKFEHRVCPAGVLGRGTNFESLTWRDFQPFAVTVIEESCSVVSHRASPLWWSARFGTGTLELKKISAVLYALPCAC